MQLTSPPLHNFIIFSSVEFHLMNICITFSSYSHIGNTSLHAEIEGVSSYNALQILEFSVRYGYNPKTEVLGKKSERMEKSIPVPTPSFGLLGLCCFRTTQAGKENRLKFHEHTEEAWRRSQKCCKLQHLSLK